jgi:hypothetical protein
MQQPSKTCGCDGGEEGEEIQLGGAWGKHDSIVLGTVELGGDKKLKKNQ